MVTVFTCAICHEEFEASRSEEEAQAEFEEHFMRPVSEDDATVCGDCYQRLAASERAEAARYGVN